MRGTTQTGIILSGLIGLAIWTTGPKSAAQRVSIPGRHPPSVAASLADHSQDSAPTLLSSAESGTLNIPTAASSNWVGISTKNLAATSVQASWTVPGWSDARRHSSVGNWVGLGGSTSKQLIQVGTVTTTNRDGNAVTRVFWERLPANAALGATISPGTKVTARIVRDGTDAWKLEMLKFGTDSVLLKKILQVPAKQIGGIESSADIITERITGSHGLVRLAPFGQTVFTGIQVNHTKLADLPVNDLTADELAHRYRTVAAAYYQPSKPDAMKVRQQSSIPVAPMPVNFPRWIFRGFGIRGATE